MSSTIEYKEGSVFLIVVEKVLRDPLAGCIYVKIIKEGEGLFFSPYLLEDAIPIPVAQIEAFEPVWISDDNETIHLEIEGKVRAQDLTLYGVMWSVVFARWEKMEVPEWTLGAVQYLVKTIPASAKN